MLADEQIDRELSVTDSFGDEAATANDRNMESGCISLRQWLDDPNRSIDSLECLHIFKQIVNIASRSHAKGIVFHNIRPSRFLISSFNRILFIESASCWSSDSDSLIDDQISFPAFHRQGRIRSDSESGSSCLSSYETPEERKWHNLSIVAKEKKKFQAKEILIMELNWYTSPEEIAGAPSSFASDIYRLGVLLFELFCTISSIEEKIGTMSDLRLRVLPSQVLLKWPKEASFSLWLLNPQPNNRPKMTDLLQSKFLNEPRDSLEENEAAVKLREELVEKDLLLEFLLQMRQIKQEMTDKLQDMIRFLSSDIDEVLKQQSNLKEKVRTFDQWKIDENIAAEMVDKQTFYSLRNEDSNNLGSHKHFRAALQIHTEEQFSSDGHGSEFQSQPRESILSKSSRLMKNFKKLESAYFSTRCQPIRPTGKLANRKLSDSSIGKGSVVQTEGSLVENFDSMVGPGEGRKGEWIDPFLEGLCKYLSFSKLEVRAELKQGDLLNSSNLVCSLSFDRDKEFFATAGVNRKIKVFDCDAILNEEHDIHYPVTEMVGRSKFSCVCWNGYIKSQIASSDFDGIVQVWDVTRGQVFAELSEHERRIWSVDFSTANPTKLASGSDDGAVKLWNINQRASVATIRMKANVCCVQFPPDSACYIAIGSADHGVYCYDLRNMRVPLCTLIGHTKTVSYIRFVDSTTLVSASTDNSLKLWDLTMSVSRVINNPMQTFTGHRNVKNFVGLSISNGYIATGSETNEVVVYHKAFPMPALSFKFNSRDRQSSHEDDDSDQFISCLCWRGQSSTLLAASSTGNIKLLEMV